MDYKQKYKNKHLQFKSQLGGAKDALEYSDWMKYAEEHKLFFGPKDYA